MQKLPLAWGCPCHLLAARLTEELTRERCLCHKAAGALPGNGPIPIPSSSLPPASPPSSGLHRTTSGFSPPHQKSHFTSGKPHLAPGSPPHPWPPDMGTQLVVFCTCPTTVLMAGGNGRAGCSLNTLNGRDDVHLISLQPQHPYEQPQLLSLHFTEAESKLWVVPPEADPETRTRGKWLVWR